MQIYNTFVIEVSEAEKKDIDAEKKFFLDKS